MNNHDPLFLDGSDEAIRVFRQKINSAADALEAGFLGRDRAYGGLTPEELEALLRDDELLPREGWGFARTAREAGRLFVGNSLKVGSPGYMAHLHGAPLIDSLGAELLLSATNQSMDSWDQSPMATEMERRVVRQLCGLAGFDSGSDGVFTSGGTQSNLMGILLGRDWFIEKKLGWPVRRDGLPPEASRLRIYTSEVSHFSVEKSARLLGLGSRAVRPVPVDSAQRMSSEALEAMIEEDLAAELIPMMVCATVGTTDFGSIDPLETIREICDRRGLWMHTDAAYGGGLLVSAKYQSRIAGVEKTDSLTVDFHKMYLQPISCGGFFLRDGSHFEGLTLHVDYLNRREDEEEGYHNQVGKSLATTRRFDALKVWFSFKSLGRRGWEEIIDRTLDNAQAVYRVLDQDRRFETVAPPEISSVVFRYTGSIEAYPGFSDGPAAGGGTSEELDRVNAAVRRRLLHQEGIILGQTRVKGQIYLKMTLLNPRVEPQKIAGLIETVAVMAGEEK